MWLTFLNLNSSLKSKMVKIMETAYIPGLASYAGVAETSLNYTMNKES